MDKKAYAIRLFDLAVGYYLAGRFSYMHCKRPEVAMMNFYWAFELVLQSLLRSRLGKGQYKSFINQEYKKSNHSIQVLVNELKPHLLRSLPETLLAKVSNFYQIRFEEEREDEFVTIIHGVAFIGQRSSVKSGIKKLQIEFDL